MEEQKIYMNIEKGLVQQIVCALLDARERLNYDATYNIDCCLNEIKLNWGDKFNIGIETVGMII